MTNEEYWGCVRKVANENRATVIINDTYKANLGGKLTGGLFPTILWVKETAYGTSTAATYFHNVAAIDSAEADNLIRSIGCQPPDEKK